MSISTLHVNYNTCVTITICHLELTKAQIPLMTKQCRTRGSISEMWKNIKLSRFLHTMFGPSAIFGFLFNRNSLTKLGLLLLKLSKKRLPCRLFWRPLDLGPWFHMCEGLFSKFEMLNCWPITLLELSRFLSSHSVNHS